MTKILIDASYIEEKRVAVIDDKNKLEEFEFETLTKQTLKGNIYLAKVTRVEPSLQAAFVDYGGNRHGFLAFSEIHPDYYQIPIADREKLEEEFAQAQKNRSSHLEDDLITAEEEEESHPSSTPETPPQEERAPEEENGVINLDSTEETLEIQVFGGDGDQEPQPAGEAAIPEEGKPRGDVSRRYKIQEVIKRNQILLIQVVKEERGNKGAALTTYLSLAGRYGVLMPNTANAGGISRRIDSLKDRKRLREILNSLDLDEKQSLIIRTAGQERTKVEIKRDFDYLKKTWNDIREKTINSIAPSLIHEEGDLIRRVVRDLYTKDVEEILIEGEESCKTAKQFMKILMPSHVKRIKSYDDDKVSLFRRYSIENQIEDLQHPEIRLPSGGSIVINLTEALVAIDINSGRSTRERHIDETAYRTNIEAAAEIGRQLRLRDLAGLIVIDFIDMDNSKHIAAVERRFRDAVKMDRARIQIGRISQFGLLELSRQRLRPSIFESLTQVCQTCGGRGHVRSVESTALAIFRSLEDRPVNQNKDVDIYVPTAVALYLFNHKRTALDEIEKRLSVKVFLHHDITLNADEFKIKGLQQQPQQPPQPKQQKSQKQEKQGKKNKKQDKPSSSQPHKNQEKVEETSPTKPQEPGSQVQDKSDKKEEITSQPSSEIKGKRRRHRRRRGKKPDSQKEDEGNANSNEMNLPPALEPLPVISPSAPITTEEATKKGWWKKLLK